MNGGSRSSSPRRRETTPMAGCTGGRKCFGPDGCPAVANGRRCGETRNLQIIQEFRRLYEDKMKQIDDAAGGDCIQAKINLQQEWIRDLTDQNEMLVRVVEELEVEAAERVTMLEDKLEQSANCACEVMESYKDISINFLPDFQKMEYLQNDLNNIIELLKRVRNDGIWSKQGLTFYTVNIDNLINTYGAIVNRQDETDALDCNCNWNGERPAPCKLERLAAEKQKRVQELEDQVHKLNDAADKHEESKKTCQELKKSMLDMRDALTAEVAEKHDTILCLRREVHMLEEQCKKAEQQTHFKDDIIKEMRKEIKQFKLQADQEKTLIIQKLTQENHQLLEDVRQANAHVERMRSELLKRNTPVEEKERSHRGNQTRPNIEFKHSQTTTVEVVGASSLENMISDKETERKLVVHLEHEVQCILYEMKGKDRQLHDQNDLITLLVQKMFSVYKVLRTLYEESFVMNLETEREEYMRQIKTLEHENAMLNDAINKVKKNLLKLEEKADRYLEERDQFKRKHNESLEMIETLQRENVRSKEALETLEDEKKANLNKLHVSMVEELEVCEKKHRDSLEQLDNLRYELEKYKTENNSSLIKVQTLSDENRNQAETIAALQEELRKSMEKPVTTSIGVNANAQIKDIGVDSYPPHTKHVSIGYAPETKTVGIFGNVDGEIVPRQYKTVSCGTELPHRQITFHPDDCTTTTSMNTCDEERPTDIVTVGKAPAKKKKDAVEILELLEPTTLEAYGCGSKVKEDVFDFVPHKLTATADKKRIRDAMKVEMLAHGRRIVIEPQYHQSSKAPCAETRKLQLQPKSHQAEILYTNPEGMYQTSNESMVSDASGAVSLEGEKPLKSVRINPNVSLPVKTSVSDEDEAVVYLSPKEHRGGTAERPPQPKLVYVSRDEDAQHREGAEERPPQTKSAMRNGEGSSRSTSPKRSKTPSSNPAEDLQNVVQDLNESVSRIIEKTPNEKACREKIAKLEAQLRAVNTNLELIRNTDQSNEIKINPLNLAQIDLQTLKQKDRDIEVERQKRNQEVENLKLTIREMEKALQNKQENSANLQGAVDLYLNSISVLEQSEERYRNEVAQQRVTISNLQEALVAAKQQLDELREKCQRDLELKCNLLDILDVSLNDLEKQCYHYYNQFINSLTTIEYLRDEMLDMEVEKFELLEDVLVLEARLLKYQQVSKQYECICGLKKEIKRLHIEIGLFKEEVESLQGYITKCHEEIDSTKTILGKYLGSECSEYCIKQNESVVTLAQDTICYTEDLQCQMSVLETALKREQKINVVQASRIEELQNIIGLKNLELSRVNDAYQDSKNKLDAATNKSKNLEDAIRELQEQLNEMELDNMYQEEKTDICHGELDMCLNNLQSVKLKMRSQYKIMCQKMQEFAQLQADCKIHANNAEMFKRDLENTRIRFRDEVIELKHNIRDLKEKLHNSDDKIEQLNKEIKHSQALLVEASHHETKIKQDFHMREQQLTEKIHSAQSEEMRLLDVVTQLEQQILDMRNDLDAKGAQLETAKQTILQMNSDSLMKQHTTQEEINSLKNEINTLLQKLGAHKADNERLQQQIECMKCCVRQNESDNNSLKMQLDKCLNDLKNAEQEKIYLEQRNMTLMGTLDKMQATIQSKSESIAHMEFELLEAKTSRDEICTESRNVVFNVRAWLDEQKRINEQLKEKLEKKDALIMKYEQERSFSKKGSRCICNSRPGYPRQRGGAQPPPYFENAPPLSRSPWSLDSRGSGSESPTSSVSSTAADWYEYEEVGYDAIIEEPTAELWVHRVESMTEELQRSNRYWKRKINDSEFMVTKDK